MRTARLIARWQEVGFAHGVMNTDNMSILGLTLDYGPFGFLDDCDPEFIPNHSDPAGRYAFLQQPGIGLWNLAALGHALLPLMTREDVQAALDAYEPTYVAFYMERLRAKLGLREEREGDEELVSGLFGLLASNGVDYTLFFRALGGFQGDKAAPNTALRDLFGDREGWGRWADVYRARLTAEGSDAAERRERMDRANPRYVLRNYLAQSAIEQAEAGDFAEVERLRALLADPFAEQPGMERYAAPPPDWGRGLVVSCSA